MYTQINPEKLKQYFFDIFKNCSIFYPTVEVSKEAIRIQSMLDGKTIKIVQKKNNLPDIMVLPIVVTKWKKKFLAKFKGISEDDVENVLDFTERLVVLHNEIRNSITKDGKIKFKDPIVITKTVNNIVKINLDKLSYLEYSASKARISFSKFVTLEVDIDYAIGKHHDVTKIQVMV